MESFNKDNEILNKSKYLIQKLFISDDIPQFNKYISCKNEFNFSINQLNINNSVLDNNIITKQITLFNKKYKNSEIQKIKNEYNKLIYFCYRRNTYPMKNRFNINVTCDSGWGCMIRCGQMIMAKAIYKYLKSKKYSSVNSISETIKYFLDIPYSLEDIPSLFSSLKEKNPNKSIINIKILPPFSIQMHCFLGKYYNKYAGEWFSDVNICQNYRDINESFELFPDLKIISFITDFNLQDILDGCFTLLNNEKNDEKKILNINNKNYIMKKCGLIFISVRLGINKITNEYYSSLKKLFECKECIGIIGGETNLAHYFIGHNDKGSLIYLDPHITRETVNVLNDDSLINDYLVKNLHEISIDDMSTALSIGFLFRTINEFEELFKFLENYSKENYPCFGFIKKKIEIDINKYENLFNDEDDF